MKSELHNRATIMTRGHAAASVQTVQGCCDILCIPENAKTDDS